MLSNNQIANSSCSLSLYTLTGMSLSRCHHLSPLWSLASCFPGFFSAATPSAAFLACWSLPAESKPTRLGRSLSSVSTSFRSLATTVTDSDYPLATEWCSCLHGSGFEWAPSRLHVIKFAGRWKMKSFWTESSRCSQQTQNYFQPAEPVGQLPKNMIHSQYVSPTCPEWWNKVIHWVLAQSVLVKYTCKRDLGFPACHTQSMIKTEIQQ